MANQRIYDEVDGLKFTTSDIEVGGVTSIGTEQSFTHNVDSLSDGVQGPSDADEAGQRETFRIVTTDVMQGIPILIGTHASMQFFGHESGVAPPNNYGKVVLIVPVPHALDFQAQRGQYATATIDGMCRFNLAASEFADVEGFTEHQAAPTLRHPLRLWQPKSVVHGSLLPSAVQSVAFSLAGRVLEDYGDTDKGMTAVDVAGFALGAVTLTIRDSGQQTGPPTHNMPTALLKNGVKDLVVSFEGVGDTPDAVLTLRNCKFRKSARAGGRDWSGYTLSGVMQWRDPSGAPPLIRTINDATPADRLINFA